MLLRPWFIGLAMVTVLNAAIGAAYYLRVIGVMYFRQPAESEIRGAARRGAALAMLACLLVVVGVGLYPGRSRGAGQQRRPIARARRGSTGNR